MKTELPQDPIPFQTDRVRVYVTRDVSFDLKKMEQITRKVLGKLGCEGCHSGRILDFIEMHDFVVNPRTLEVEELMGSHRIGG